MFSLESPQRGDSNEYTQYTISQYKKKIILNYPKSATMGFVPRDPKRVRISRGKQAISVRAIEVQLYLVTEVLRERREKEISLLEQTRFSNYENKTHASCKYAAQNT